MIDVVNFVSVYMALGAVMAVIYCRKAGCGERVLLAVIGALIYRMVFTIFYYYYFLGALADARAYYNFALAGGFDIGEFLTPGRKFIINLVRLLLVPAGVFDNAYFMLYLPFSLIAFAGSLLFFEVLKTFGLKRTAMVYALSFYLPNIVFWSSNVGKDSLAYFGIMLFIYSLLLSRGYRRIAGLAAASAIVYLVRPHVLWFLYTSLLLDFFFQRKRIEPRRVMVTLLFLLAAVLVYRPILRYVGLDTVVSEDAKAFTAGEFYDEALSNITHRARDLDVGGSAQGFRPIEIFKAPIYAIKFIGGPFIWEAKKPMQLFSSLESALYLGVLVYLLFHAGRFVRKRGIPHKYFWVFYILQASVLFGMTFTNYGLAVRQRCMVIPFMMVLLAAVMSDREKSRMPEGEAGQA